MNTELIYNYTGPRGDSAEETVVVRGTVPNSADIILGACPEPGKFSPELVSLPDLKDRVQQVTGSSRDCWHSISAIRETPAPPSNGVTIDELITRFLDASADGWPIELSGAMDVLFPE